MENSGLKLYNNMKKLHKYNIEQKKIDTKSMYDMNQMI